MRQMRATGETVKLQLSGTMPATGSRVAVIFSCNGMDVVHVYTREEETTEAQAVVEDAVVEEEIAVEEEPVIEEEVPVEEEVEEVTVREIPELIPDELVSVGLPLGKILMLAVLAILAVVDVIWMFRKRRK